MQILLCLTSMCLIVPKINFNCVFLNLILQSVLKLAIRVLHSLFCESVPFFFCSASVSGICSFSFLDSVNPPLSFYSTF